jgi:taurine dioxygenase
VDLETSDLQINPTTPVIGAEILGADLANPTDDTFALIEQALTDHQVVFFRDQPELSADQQIAFARHFGDLHIHPAAPDLESHPGLFVIHAHKDSKVANGNGWHTDVSCDEKPPLATMLQMHILPSSGGDTLFASMFAAFETLSPALQGFLSTLTATHGSEHVYRGRYAERGVNDDGKTYPSAIHPVVRTHPRSGRQALYVNPSFTTHINELSHTESRALLKMLYEHQQRPELQVRFQWTQNAIAIWDNRCTQHFALWDYWPEERKGHRVTIQGERPYFDPNPAAKKGSHRVPLRLAKQLS